MSKPPRKPLDDLWADIYRDYDAKISSTANTTEVITNSDIIKDSMLTPKEIVRELDRTVIGQTEAKELVAISVYNRLLSLDNRMSNRLGEDYFFEKNNVLLIGGTGCGKTHMIKALSRAVNLPVSIQDATSYTASGYVGEDIEGSIQKLASAAHEHVKDNFPTRSAYDQALLVKDMIEYGIIYIDEADKIRASSGSGKDVNGRSVQEGFLKLVEGSISFIKTPSYKGPVDTSNMLFIFGGAFSGLTDLIEQRLKVTSMGFHGTLSDKGRQISDTLKKSTVPDFTSFGMIPELLGRLSTVAVLDALDRETIFKIFVEPDRSIMSQVINEFKSFGVSMSFSDDAINYIIDETMKLNLGARGLKAICQKVLRPLYFYFPSNVTAKEVIVTRELLEKLEKVGKIGERE